MKRPNYKAAVAWLADNTDIGWLTDDNDSPSVAACLVADMFGKDTAVVTADLRRHVAKEGAK